MTFAIATLLGAMALGTDVAVMYFNWVQLQKGADAAAIGGRVLSYPIKLEISVKSGRRRLQQRTSGQSNGSRRCSQGGLHVRGQ